jgi:hypothetical protein
MSRLFLILQVLIGVEAIDATRDVTCWFWFQGGVLLCSPFPIRVSVGWLRDQASRASFGASCSLFGTWIAQHLNLFRQCLALLASSSSLG